ncbi:MAG: monovalent cation/H(+) antiporter subunit G [Bacteroidota bacterium]|nr:monovalent cation/H(+) antiporter subunit G [Bacteroidota bacterium]
MNILDILGSVILVAGLIFVLIGSIGIIRFPDFYTRTHAAGKCDTLGLVLVLIGLGFHVEGMLNTIKLLLIAVFIAIANPTATHAIARAAYRLGLKPLLDLKSKDSQNDTLS